MKGIVRFTAGIVLAATLLAPFSASAQAQAGLSFGGRITFVLPCLSLLGPSVWTVIVPAPFTKFPAYVWTVATLRGGPPSFIMPDLPPPFHPGQEIAGIADIPFWCCAPGSVPTPVPFSCISSTFPFVVWPPLPGQRMQWANQSVI